MAVEEEAVSGQADSGDAGATKTDSLSDAISAALSGADSDNEEPAPQQEPDPSVKDGAGDKRDGEDASAAETDAKAKDAAARKGDAKPFEAPKHWPEADRKAFAEMPPEAQQIVRRLAKDLEGGFTRKSQELGDKARYADVVRGLIDDQTRQQIERAGANEIQYFAHLHRLNDFSTRDPVGYIRWAMQNLGVRPEHVLPAQQQPAQQPSGQADLDALLSDP
jgi:hypothetical protein